MLFDARNWKVDERSWNVYCSVIDEVESLRIGRFRRPISAERSLTRWENVDARCSLAGRLLLRLVLRNVCKLRSEEVKLGRSEKGKPFLDHHLSSKSGFQFNISHSGGLVALAYCFCTSVNSNLGVDIMENRAIASGQKGDIEV